MEDEDIRSLQTLFEQALNEVYERDGALIKDGGLEQACVARFVYYFQTILNESKFNSYNLDCEYHKNKGLSKVTPIFKKGIRPDIILHKRGNNDHNLLAAEFKTYKNRSHASKSRWPECIGKTELEVAKLKLQELTNDGGGYEYKLGLLVTLNKDEPQIERISR
jgi:hypothetical protein